MSEHDETTPGGHDPCGQPGSGRGDGGATPDWRERAAFHLSAHYSSDDAGQLVWQTRAYHEESDTHQAWPGLPGEALLAWLHAVADLPAEAANAGEAPSLPSGGDQASDSVETMHEQDEVPAVDDFKQIIGISGAVEQRLHEAGIRTYGQLAASTVAELSVLLDLSIEWITRRGWITRARALAKLAALPSRAAKQAIPEEPASRAGSSAEAAPALHVEVRFDEHGNVIDQRLLRKDLHTTPTIGPESSYIAEFFVDSPPGASELAVAGATRLLTAELELEVDELQIEQLPPRNNSRVGQLRAHSRLRLTGINAERLVGERATFLTHVLGYDLERGGTTVLVSVVGQLDPQHEEVRVELIFALPEVGRYQLAITVLLAEYQLLGAASGPRLRVNR